MFLHLMSHFRTVQQLLLSSNQLTQCLFQIFISPLYDSSTDLGDISFSYNSFENTTKKPQNKKTNTDFRIDVMPLSEPSRVNSVHSNVPNFTQVECERFFSSKLPFCDFKGYSNEWREIVDVIMGEMVPKNLGIAWDDCVGLEDDKELLKETVVYPNKYEELFHGLATPWRG